MLSVHSSTCLRVVFLLLHPLKFLQLIHFFIVQRGIHCFFGKTKYQLHSGQRKLCKENNENFVDMKYLSYQNDQPVETVMHLHEKFKILGRLQEGYSTFVHISFFVVHYIQSYLSKCMHKMLNTHIFG